MDGKVCPFAAAHPHQENSSCLGEACACYITLIELHTLKLADRPEFVDREYFCRYSGCGLVAQIPWTFVKIESKQRKPKTPT